MGSMQLLADTILTPEQKDLVNISMVCGNQLLAVISDILDISKMEENKMMLENNSFSLVQTVQESLEVVLFEAEKKRNSAFCEYFSKYFRISQRGQCSVTANFG